MNYDTDFGTKNLNLNNELSFLYTDLMLLNSFSFDGWSGSASNNYQNSFKTCRDNFEIEYDKLVLFSELLNKVEIYKKNKEQIIALQKQYEMVANGAAYDNERTNIASMISKLQAENEQLKMALNVSFQSFGGVGTKYTLNSDLFNFSAVQTETLRINFNINELLNRFKNDDLHYLNEGESLYDYYGGDEVGREYVRQVLANIQSTYSGREAAVNSALALIQMCSDAGIKIDYEHKGTNVYEPYVPTDQVVTGVDCNPTASWIIDKGTPGGFVWRPVSEFTNIGQKLDDWSLAKPGDVLASPGHVAVIVHNDPVNQQFITVESSNGVEIRTRTYKAMLKDNYQVQDLTNVYNGTENTYRKSFDEHVDITKHQRRF